MIVISVTTIACYESKNKKMTSLLYKHAHTYFEPYTYNKSVQEARWSQDKKSTT